MPPTIASGSGMSLHTLLLEGLVFLLGSEAHGTNLSSHPHMGI